MSQNNPSPSNSFSGSPIEGDGRLSHWYCLSLIIFKGLARPTLQHILTLLSMAIGSLALAATLFVGQGALQGLWKDLDRLMGNKVIIYADAGPGQELLKVRSNIGFAPIDLDALKDNLPTAKYIAPRYFGAEFVAYKNKGQRANVDGIATEQFSEQAYQPLRGRSFSPKADQGLIREALLTVSLAKILGIESLNNTAVRLGEHRFQVVGIIPDPPDTDPRFQPRIVLPFFTCRMLWGRPDSVDNLVVAWTTPEDMDAIISGLRATLDQTRVPGAYYLSSSEFTVKKRKNIVSNFMVFGTVQAFFCILIASIGVVNVMLANVVRRAREFAIREAMGASKRDIVILVLSESCLLGLGGGILGILLAMGLASPICDMIAARVPEASRLVPHFGLRGILIPMLVCSISSLLAGIVPALRARQTDILSVLRAE